MWFHRNHAAAVSLDKPRPVIRGGLARTAQVKEMYRHDPSFTDLLPWAEWLPNEQMLLHSDGQSVGIAYELVKAPIDGRSQEVQGEVRDSVQRILLDAFPRRDDPYVLQTHLQDERGLGTYLRALRQEMSPAVRDSTFTQHYLTRYCQLDRRGYPAGIITA